MVAICKTCREEKAIAGFTPTPHGHRRECRACRAKVMNAYYHRTKVLKRPIRVRDRDGLRQCARCEKWSPLNLENYIRRKHGYWETICKPCKNAKTLKWMKDNRSHSNRRRQQLRRENPEKTAAEKRRHVYKLSDAQYRAMYEIREGRCWICSTHYQSLHVDHCHKTNRIRGLLCRACNLALGMMKDDPLRLHRAADYLEKGA